MFMEDAKGYNRKDCILVHLNESNMQLIRILETSPFVVRKVDS
jgi:hypothetical protein